MSHIFINVDVDKDIDSMLLKHKEKISLEAIEDFGCTFYYDKLDWDFEPLIKSPESTLLLSGWFVFEGKRNNLFDLKKYLDDNIELMKKNNDFSSINSMISSGIFCAVYIFRNEVFIFTDPFGLSSHFYLEENDNNFRLCPYPSAFEQKIDGNLNAFLSLQGHLFGNYTAFKNVYRLMPNEVIQSESVRKKHVINSYEFELSSNIIPNERLINHIKNLLDLWENKSLSLALSAGFDSRFISAACDPEFTYTWGPKTSLDQTISKKIADHKNTNHLSFMFRDVEITSDDEELCRKIFSGVVANYNPQFFSNYKYVASISNRSHVALDGYLGDVLQRGVYLYPPNFKGEFHKVFPSRLVKSFSCKDILRARYSSVDDEMFNLLYQDFLVRTNNIDEIDELNKVTYYEFLYGRGLRYISTGAIVMNSIFKTVVPCFAERSIFSSLLKNSTVDIANYTVFRTIWHDVDVFYSSLISEGLYSPKTNTKLVPFLNFFGRIVTNKIPYYYNYTKE